MVGAGITVLAMPDDTRTQPPTNQPSQVPSTAPEQILDATATGIGEWEFGDPADEVITDMTESFGAPDDDTAWDELDQVADGFSVNGGDSLSATWDHRQLRTVCWQSLCAVFGGDTVAAATFRGWALTSIPEWNDYEPVDVTQPRIALAGSGITLGDTWADFQAAYPDAVPRGAEGASLGIAHPPWPGIFDGADEWRLSGTWDYTRPRYAPPGSEVTRMSAGEGPEPGCC